MERLAFLSMIGLLLLATPASADLDGDGVEDANDNCVGVRNPYQDDTDLDDCGNLCDADYDQDGKVGFTDFGIFLRCFPTNDPLCDHTEPVGSGPKGFADFGTFGQLFGGAPGPSGTTVGTTACP